MPEWRCMHERIVYDELALTMPPQFPSITIDPEWCPAECLGRHVALTAPGTHGMNLWEIQRMLSLARRAVRCMLDPWGEVRMQSRRVLRELEYPLITAALTATRGNQIRAAELLGLNRNTLRKKIRDLDIQVIRAVR